MYALEILIDRLRTARFVGRALALVKELGPYAAVELILPGGTLIALGLWLYARHKAGKPLLPFRLRSRITGNQAMAGSEPLFGRPAIEGLFTSRSEAPCQP